MPSHTDIERPSGHTSHSRTTQSVSGADELAYNTAVTGLAIARSASGTSDVYVTIRIPPDQEGAHRWAIHDSVVLAIQPVVVPADALRPDVKLRIWAEVQFARLALVGVRTVGPGADHPA